MTDLSVVIPISDEEVSLPLLWSELRVVLERLELTFEVLFVDNGSHDRSADIIRTFSQMDRRVRLLRLKTNAGETAAIAAGFKAVRGANVVAMDATLHNDPADIPRLLAHLHRWDAATGWRLNRDAGDTFVRQVAARIANCLRQALSGGEIPDGSCNFHAFRRECLRELMLYRGFHRFIPTLLQMQGYRVVEVPVGHRPRRCRPSPDGGLHRCLGAFIDLLAIRWMRRHLLRYEIAEDVGVLSSADALEPNGWRRGRQVGGVPRDHPRARRSDLHPR
jgi:dolichol-phosphate mannosyltransferase